MAAGVAMGVTNKPLWFEGMFVRPQHFQQYDRWIEHLVERRAAGLRAHGWGLSAFSFDAELLGLGRLVVTDCIGVMPDGTVIDIPNDVPPPPPLTVPPNVKDRLVKLAIPVRPRDGAEVGLDAIDVRRYEVSARSVRDATAPQRDAMEIRVGRLNLKLLIEGEPEGDYVTLPLARIQEVEPAGRIILSDLYIPPCVDYQASQRLVQVLREILSMLRSRGEALAVRADPSRATAESAGLVDLLVLSIVNAAEATLQHIANVQGLHPEELFRELVRLVGQLSTFDARRRRPPDLAAYRHDQLELSVEPVLAALRQFLAVVVERNVVALSLQERGYGILTATITDRSIFQGSRFILAAIASVPSETVRTQLPSNMKIGSIEQIRDLVNLQLPGIPMRSLPVAPRELPYLSGAVYFELDQSVELWRALPRSAAFALHVSGDYPDLHLEFWAVREN
ncbi:MAG: type VI secretion system baseplate subunit TssK [Methylovirgula sp.]